jgi:hypothetical protein
MKKLLPVCRKHWRRKRTVFVAKKRNKISCNWHTSRCLCTTPLYYSSAQTRKKSCVVKLYLYPTVVPSSVTIRVTYTHTVRMVAAIRTLHICAVPFCCLQPNCNTSNSFLLGVYLPCGTDTLYSARGSECGSSKYEGHIFFLWGDRTV